MRFKNVFPIAFGLLLLPISASAESFKSTRDSVCETFLGFSRAEVTATAFSAAAAENLTRVREFAELRAICERLGVRCWLFGGTAAGFAHYLKWDLLQRAGDTRFQPDRFDYGYDNIYRSTQDADLVIDGTVEQAEQVESELREFFPHVQGGKSVWEVRLLRTSRGDKGALIGNPDFLRQHTDSNSTGMIEVTSPPAGESVIRDLRDWKAGTSRPPIFLRDVLDGRLHYYFSPKHGQTRRAREGLNPPILSVIRYLTKAFQYELQTRPEDEARIREIIEEFNPRSGEHSSYVKGWVERNGKKLFQHAVNLEYAWEKLESLGLRKKLMDWNPGTLKTEGSLAWWMNRKPLSTFPVGRGSGKTASELGLSRVAHETRDFLAYESITRAHTGDPNVFISRSLAAGEFAAHGDGFYAAVGNRGARGTGITIRFQVNPDAREGSDFVLARGPNSKASDGAYVVFLNKAALRIVPEGTSVTLVDYFTMLSDSQFMATERALVFKFKRRMMSRSRSIQADEAAELEVVLAPIFKGLSENPIHYAQWFQVLVEALKLTQGSVEPALKSLHERAVELLARRIEMQIEAGKSPGRGELFALRESKVLSEISVSPRLRDAMAGLLVHTLDLISLVEVRDLVSELAKRDEGLVDSLLERLSDPGCPQRARIAEILVHLNSLSQKSVEALIRALEDRDPRVRESAAAALGSSGGTGEGVIQALIARMGDPSIQVRKNAFQSLTAIGREHREFKETALGMIENERDPELVHLAVEALAPELDKDPRVRSSVLVLLENHPQGKLMFSVSRAFDAPGRFTADYAETLVRMTSHPSDGTRTFAFEQLFHHRVGPEVFPAPPRHALKDGNQAIRAVAANLFLSWDPFDVESLLIVLKACRKEKNVNSAREVAIRLAIEAYGENGPEGRTLLGIFQGKRQIDRTRGLDRAIELFHSK